MNRIIAKLIPQIFIHDLVVETGLPEHFDVTGQILSMNVRNIHQLTDRHDSTDILIDLTKTEHVGPFDVEVVQSICAYFGVHDLSQINHEMVSIARKRRRKRKRSDGFSV